MLFAFDIFSNSGFFYVKSGLSHKKANDVPNFHLFLSINRARRKCKVDNILPAGLPTYCSVKDIGSAGLAVKIFCASRNQKLL